MNDTDRVRAHHGEITLDGENIYGRHMDVVMLRARVGMVFPETESVPEVRLRQRRIRASVSTGSRAIAWSSTRSCRRAASARPVGSK
jgi:ABC-type phosphate transport system ATPase subunit